jgi:hypothetical protein
MFVFLGRFEAQSCTLVFFCEKWAHPADERRGDRMNRQRRIRRSPASTEKSNELADGSATVTENEEDANVHYRTSVHVLRSSRKCRNALQFPEMSPIFSFFMPIFPEKIFKNFCYGFIYDVSSAGFCFTSVFRYCVLPCPGGGPGQGGNGSAPPPMLRYGKTVRLSLPHRRRRVFLFFDCRSSFSRFSDFI